LKILDNDIALTDNLKSSFKRYRYGWLILLFTMLLDFVTTVYFMQNKGIHLEQNLAVRWLAYTLGIVPGVMTGKLLQLCSVLGLTALSFKLSRAILLLVILLNLLAVFINLL
jgi:hypothetical protein